MHVLIPVFFRAPLGGLHANVAATVRALLRTGHRATVVCKPGTFADAVRALGAAVVETDFEDVGGSADAIDALGPIDLVHAHPYASRIVGLEVARRRGVPMLLTQHSLATRGAAACASELSLIVAVSPAIRDKLVADGAAAAERVLWIPNGVDTEVFRPLGLDWRAALDTGERRVLMVCRLDPDKQFVLDRMVDAWRQAAHSRSFDLRFVVAGDGSERSALNAAAREVAAQAGRPLVTFLGWQDEPALARLYNSCHVAVAPGRSAMDAMACGAPTIALGSRGYVGVVDGPGVLRGIHGNFGGAASPEADQSVGALFRDIETIARDDARLVELGNLGRETVAALYAQPLVDAKLLHAYRICLAAPPPAARVEQARNRLERPALVFDSRSWKHAAADCIDVSVDEGRLCVSFELTADDRFYVTSSSNNFSRPPEDAAAWALVPGRRYELSTAVRVHGGDPAAQLWVIQYDAERRLEHHRVQLRGGRARVSFAAASEARSFKVALRFAGAGAVEIDPLVLYELSAAR